MRKRCSLKAGRKSLSILLMLAMCLSLLPGVAIADETTEAGYTEAIVLPVQYENTAGMIFNQSNLPQLVISDEAVTVRVTDFPETVSNLKPLGIIAGSEDPALFSLPLAEITIPAYPQEPGEAREAWLKEWRKGIRVVYESPVLTLRYLVLEDQNRGSEQAPIILQKNAAANRVAAFHVHNTGSLTYDENGWPILSENFAKREWYWTATGLPEGMSLVPEGNGAVLNGTPHRPGDYVVKIQATEKYVSGESLVQVQIEPLTIHITVQGEKDYFYSNNSQKDFWTSGEYSYTTLVGGKAYTVILADYDTEGLSAKFESHLKRTYPQANYKSLLANLQNHEFNAQWGGSCFGFSSITGMLHTGAMNMRSINLYDANANNLTEVDRPVNNHQVRGYINYYQLSQMIPYLRSDWIYPLKGNYSNSMIDTGEEAMLELAQRLAQATAKGEPITIHFSYFMANGSGHAVILDGAEKKADGSYVIHTRDNRYHQYRHITDLRASGSSVQRYTDLGPASPELQVTKDGQARMYMPSYNNGRGYVLLMDKTPDDLYDNNFGFGGLSADLVEEIYEFEYIDDFSKFAEFQPQQPKIIIPDPVVAWNPYPAHHAVVYVVNTKENSTLNVHGDDTLLLEGTGNHLYAKSDAVGNVYFTAGSTVEEGADGIITPVYTPTERIAELNSASEVYTLSSPDGAVSGSISTVGEEFLHAEVAEADTVKLHTVHDSVQLAGNTGEFTAAASLAGGDITATVSGIAEGDISLSATGSDTITLTAPAGEYEVTFRNLDGQENVQLLKSNGSPVTLTSTVPAEAPLPFTDVAESDSFYDAVRFVYENGLIVGMNDTTFAPYGDVTRAQVVSILYRMEGRPNVSGTIPFGDVPTGQWYSDAVLWAAAEGIVAGYTDGNFYPDYTITREQLVSILYRYVQYKGIDVSVGENTNILSYEDAFEISEYAIPAFQWACGAGVMNYREEGHLDPGQDAVRADAAVMLMNFYDHAVR